MTNEDDFYLADIAWWVHFVHFPFLQKYSKIAVSFMFYKYLDTKNNELQLQNEKGKKMEGIKIQNMLSKCIAAADVLVHLKCSYIFISYISILYNVIVC